MGLLAVAGPQRNPELRGRHARERRDVVGDLPRPAQFRAQDGDDLFEQRLELHDGIVTPSRLQCGSSGSTNGAESSRPTIARAYR